MTVEQVASQILEDVRLAETCCHYWIIDPPEGPVSQGVCRYCGEVGEFENFLREVPTDLEFSKIRKQAV